MKNEWTKEIDRLKAENKELLEACREMCDFYGDSGWMVDNGLSIALIDLFGKHYNKPKKRGC